MPVWYRVRQQKTVKASRKLAIPRLVSGMISLLRGFQFADYLSETIIFLPCPVLMIYCSILLSKQFRRHLSEKNESTEVSASRKRLGTTDQRFRITDEARIKKVSGV